MDLIFAITLCIFFLLFFATASFGLYLWLNKDEYTREKFAFTGLAAASTLTAFVVASIVADEPPWLAVLGLIRQVLGQPYQSPQPLTGEQEILSILLVVGFWWFILRLHSHWNGAQSTNHYEQQQQQQPPTPFADAWLYLHPGEKRQLLEVYNPANQNRLIALEGAKESLVWHEQAKDLLELSSRQYGFPEDEWHDQAYCWIGTHKGTGNTVVLACHESQPDAEELQALADYADKVRRNQGRNGNSLEFILALKEGNIDEQSRFKKYPLRIVSESRLLDGLVNFDDYFRDLRKRVEKDELTGSDLTLEQVYTVSRYKLDKEGEAQPGLETFLNNWLDEPGLRQIALLGEYGQGKSTASLMLSYHLMLRIQQDPRQARIPILLELRGKSPRTLREDELLSTWAGRYGIDTRALIKLLVDGRLLLIFEGFDEVDLSGDADARIEHFKIMWGLCYPKAKILVTGRPNYFLDDAELKAALGIQDPSLERPYCQAVHLAPFGFKDMEHSLRNLNADTREGILALAVENARFRDIVSRPSMLHVVNILWQTENLAQFGDRINSALVMDLFVRHSLERQGGKGQKYGFSSPSSGNAKPAFMALNSRERGYFMEGIATYMLINDLPNQITARQLEEIGRMLITAIPDAVSLVDAQSGEPRKPLRQRYDLANRPEDAQTILTDIRTCGLLVPDLSRSGSFKFGHKSFMEFLAGKVFAQWSLRKELEDAVGKAVGSLVNKLGLKIRHVVQQQEVMAFAVEWIAEKALDSNQAINLLFKLIFKSHSIGHKLRITTVKTSIMLLPFISFVDMRKIGARTLKTYVLLLFIAVTLVFTTIASNASFATNFIFSFFFGYLCFLIFERGFLVCIRNNHTTPLGRVESFIFWGFLLSMLCFLIYSEIFEYWTILIVSCSIPAILIFSATLDLLFGYCNPDSTSEWMNFRIWHAICVAAHLERSAVVGVIGEKSLRLLEEVANHEPRPWTIEESLEKLKPWSSKEMAEKLKAQLDHLDITLDKLKTKVKNQSNEP